MLKIWDYLVKDKIHKETTKTIEHENRRVTTTTVTTTTTYHKIDNDILKEILQRTTK